MYSRFLVLFATSYVFSHFSPCYYRDLSMFSRRKSWNIYLEWCRTVTPYTIALVTQGCTKNFRTVMALPLTPIGHFPLQSLTNISGMMGSHKGSLNYSPYILQSLLLQSNNFNDSFRYLVFKCHKGWGYAKKDFDHEIRVLATHLINANIFIFFILLERIIPNFLTLYPKKILSPIRRVALNISSLPQSL